MAGGAKRFELPFDKRRLASYLGITPENLSRALRALRAHGVDTDGQLITLREPADRRTNHVGEVTMTKSMPGAASDLASAHPDIWKAHSAVGKVAADCGPLTDRGKRRDKLALAIGVGSEGAMHSHTRCARAEGMEPEALVQVAMLAIGPLGLPRAVAAKTWIEDIDA